VAPQKKHLVFPEIAIMLLWGWPQELVIFTPQPSTQKSIFRIPGCRVPSHGTSASTGWSLMFSNEAGGCCQEGQWGKPGPLGSPHPGVSVAESGGNGGK